MAVDADLEQMPLQEHRRAGVDDAAVLLIANSLSILP